MQKLHKFSERTDIPEMIAGFSMPFGETVRINGANIEVDVTVTNTGDLYAGKEVIQVYYSAPKGNIAKPHQELAAFAKTNTLAPGESQTLTITYPAKNMASYCEKCASWVLEPGSYMIRVGNSSRNNTVVAKVVLSELVKTEVLKNAFTDTDAVKKIKAPEANVEVYEDIPEIILDASAVQTIVTIYQGKRQPYHTDHAKKLTCVGTLKIGKQEILCSQQPGR